MIDLKRFVELANKCAPELEASFVPLNNDDCYLRLGLPTHYFVTYIPGGTFQNNATFTFTLLEYLKGQRQQLSDKFSETEDTSDYRKYMVADTCLQHRWLRLTPEAVIQACIDYWEAME